MWLWITMTELGGSMAGVLCEVADVTAHLEGFSSVPVSVLGPWLAEMARHLSNAPVLHVGAAATSPQEATGLFARSTLASLVAMADRRDVAAEVRDRLAEARDAAAKLANGGARSDRDQAANDRELAGRDRDLAAGDRADLIALLGST
jgi:hypothetical protein